MEGRGVTQTPQTVCEHSGEGITVPGAALHPVSLFPPLCVPQVKQIMEEAVTRKFVHEDSSHIISFCGEW